jgi:all-trans-retinol 13,14-reductase
MPATTVTDAHYDAIIIGSGIGGLTTASLLAQLHKKRVLILERHFKLGGFTHTFARKGKYEWDVGLHYVGGVEKGEVARAVFDLITDGRLDWKAMPAVYDRLVFPDLTFDVRAGAENLKADLVARFPSERPSIDRYFKALKKANRWLAVYSVTQALPKVFRPLVWLARKFGAGLALATTADYLSRNVKDPRLRAVLLGQWGLYGLPPGRSAFVGHALLVNHYLDGGYYPVGGSGVIAEAIVPIVERHGGRALVNHSVDEILIDDGRAIGVRAVRKKGKEEIEQTFYSDVIVSNAGAHTTYTRLLGKTPHLAFAGAIRNFPEGTANVTLYLGLKDDPSSLGFRGENYWIYSGYDHEQIFDKRNDLVKGAVSHVYLSFPSMKNPEAKGHTAEIISFVDKEPFLEWEDKPWKRRGDDYEKLKSQISEALIAFVENRFPSPVGLTKLN